MNRKLLALATALMVVALVAGGVQRDDRAPRRRVPVRPEVPPPAASAPASATPAAPVTLTLWHNYGTEANATVDRGARRRRSRPRTRTSRSRSSPSRPTTTSPCSRRPRSRRPGPTSPTHVDRPVRPQEPGLPRAAQRLHPDGRAQEVQGHRLRARRTSTLDDGVLSCRSTSSSTTASTTRSCSTRPAITSFPTTWDELFAACDKLKAAGITAVHLRHRRPGARRRLLPVLRPQLPDDVPTRSTTGRSSTTGEIPWTDPAIVRPSSTSGLALRPRAARTTDVLTNHDSVAQFETGKAAMTLEGTWDIAEFQEKMGDKVGVFVPPFADTADQGRRRVRRQRLRHDHLLPAQGRRRPTFLAVDGVRRGPEDHRRRRAHPDQVRASPATSGWP